ncbi:hypothetical protein VP01_963g1 [Puccinia sorghi]|uniref:Uncharacterized protein n=1 Tax=Puccinia sorghi TaxID=27349 RepID=A0A0L6U646_9BASI|nr:hypothetical protein VP01_963g1 [Puccinia sorghi]
MFFFGYVFYVGGDQRQTTNARVIHVKIQSCLDLLDALVMLRPHSANPLASGASMLMWPSTTILLSPTPHIENHRLTPAQFSKSKPATKIQLIRPSIGQNSSSTWKKSGFPLLLGLSILGQKKYPNSTIKLLLELNHLTHTSKPTSSIPKLVITKFAFWNAQNCNITIDLTFKEWCNQAQKIQTVIPSRHQIAQLVASGRRAELSDLHRQWHLKDLTPLDYSQNYHIQEKMTRIQNSLQSMTSFDREKHLESIKQLLEDLASLIDIQLPKGSQATKGQPTAAAKKLKNTEPRSPSGFEFQPKKCKLQVKEEIKSQLKEEEKTQHQPSSSLKPLILLQRFLQWLKITLTIYSTSRRMETVDSEQFLMQWSFFQNLKHTDAKIWVDNNKPCGINHWMSMPTTGLLLVELQYFFPSSSGPNNNPPIFLALTSFCGIEDGG